MAKNAALAKIGRLFVSRAETLALIGVNKDRACLGIRVTRRNRGIRKQNDTLARLRPTQAVATGTAFGRIYDDERVIRCSRVYYAPRRVCNFGSKRNDVKARGFHERQLNPTPRGAHRRNSGKEFCSRFPVGSAASPKGRQLQLL